MPELAALSLLSPLPFSPMGRNFRPAPRAGKAGAETQTGCSPVDYAARSADPDGPPYPSCRQRWHFLSGGKTGLLSWERISPEFIRNRSGGRDKNKRLRELFHNDPIYLRMLNEKEYNALGMNSMELQPVTDTVLCFENPFPLHPVLQAGLRKYVTRPPGENRESAQECVKSRSVPFMRLIPNS